ncbi:MAG TPA: SxtJ family membrane protein [Verrucomicrobiota bacterium]|nr:SxtJ family membrane protein [Verrucomicrobiota bacterium]
MNIRQDIKQLKTDVTTLRKFGLMVGGVFLAIGLLFLWRHPGRTPYFAWPGGVLMFAGAVFPHGLKWVYVAWMSVAFILGFVMAHVILVMFFYCVVTPVGLVARVFGKDFLRLKRDNQAGSYWIRREKSLKTQADYERQY